MKSRPYPSARLLRRPDRWEVLDRETRQETARLRLGGEQPPWAVSMSRQGHLMAGEKPFSSLYLLVLDGDTPRQMFRLLPLASGRIGTTAGGRRGIDQFRQAIVASQSPESRARLTAAQALAEAAASALPEGTEWCLRGLDICASDSPRPLALPALRLPRAFLKDLFVWTDPAEDKGLWPLPWRGADLGGIRGTATARSAHARAILFEQAEACLAALLGGKAARRAIDIVRTA